jgi:hypothetical protein
MIKVLHVVAIGALISSALYAYTIKYETLYHGEQLTKLTARIQKEREAIAVLKAEWQHLNRPERLQMLVERHLQLQPLAITQIVRFPDVPNKGPRVDSIAQKLDALGADPRPTASIPPRAATTPATRPRPAAAATPRPQASTAARPLTPRPAQPPRPATQAAQSPAPRTAASANAPMVLRPPGSVPQPSRPAQR